MSDQTVQELFDEMFEAKPDKVTLTIPQQVIRIHANYMSILESQKVIDKYLKGERDEREIGPHSKS